MSAKILFSTAEDYFRAAVSELRAIAPNGTIERLAPETGCLEAAGLQIADVADACRHRPCVFVRHLAREVARVPSGESARTTDLICQAVERLVVDGAIGTDVALQVWTDGVSPPGPRPDELWHRVSDHLIRHQIQVSKADRECVISVCLTPRGTAVASNRRHDGLADWPGGRVRLARDDSQVSRSEFKLEELYKVSDIHLPDEGVALDLGASPGGWTRILRQRGFDVWAVDPADLDPRVVTDPGVRHVRTTAGRFLAETDLKVDVVVNDMRMVPELSCAVMLQAAKRLRPGGLAIVTLKLSPREALATVTQSLRQLRRSYEILFARQLFHNRNEVTVVARRRGGLGTTDSQRRIQSERPD
jgi:23S rRNA (cytidine2498-2'-O)-methyltransferase